MYLFTRIANQHLYLSVINVIGLIISLNITACNCNPAGTDTKQDGSLTIDVTNTRLIGNSKTIEAILKLSDENKTASLEQFKINVSFLEGNGSDNEISYEIYVNGKATTVKATSIEEMPITDFTKNVKMGPKDEPLKVLFHLIPGKGVKRLVASFTLLDAANQPIDDSIEVNWEEEIQPIKLERINAEHIEGANKTIQLKVINYESQQLEVNELKLKAIRTIGTSAIINGAILTNNMNEYEITLDNLINNENVIHDLNIISNTDTQVKYTLQLMYKGKLIGNKVKVNWEKGIELTLSDIKYDENSQLILYTVKNTGSIAASNLKIQYISKTTGIKLDNNSLITTIPNIKSLVNLNPGATLKDQVLGKLDFGVSKNADFEFKLACEEGATIIQYHTFNIENVDLYFEKIIYDQDKGIIIYNIKNKGTSKTTKEVKLKYSNVSKENNIDGRDALIEETDTATINLGEILADDQKIEDKELAIDLKYADKATFKFELIYNGNILKHATRVETFKAKPIQLKLIPITSLRLIGAEQEIKCKIELDQSSRPLFNIDLSKLKLAITNELNTEAYLSKTVGGLEIKELTGNTLENFTQEFTLHVNTKTANECLFNLLLKYKDSPITTPIQVSWEEAILEIVEVTELINSNTSYFKLNNLHTSESIDAKSITIQLITNNNAKFVLLTPDNNIIGTSASLDQLTKLNLITPENTTSPIHFKLSNACEETKATITITVKRGDVKLDSRNIMWEKQEANIKTTITNVYFNEKTPSKITLSNIGNTISTDKIMARLTSNKGSNFKLGNVSGNKIDTDLKQITDIDILEKDDKIEIILQAEEFTNQYCDSPKLEILDINNNTIYSHTLSWTNHDKIESELGLKTVYEIYDNFKEAKSNAKSNEANPIIWYNYIKEIINYSSEFENATSVSNNKFILMNEDDIFNSETKEELKIFFSNTINKWHEEINNYIIQSMYHAQRQVDAHAKLLKDRLESENFISDTQLVIKPAEVAIINEEARKNALPRQWIASFLKLTGELRMNSKFRELAIKIREDAERTNSKRLQDILTTPEKRKEVKKQFEDEEKALKNPRVRRSLFINPRRTFTNIVRTLARGK